ncbi:MAG: hypothetical protein ABSA18_01885 [Dehalococcoidia bacterium]
MKMYDHFYQVTSGFEEKAKKLACGSNAWIFKARKDRHNKTKQLLEKLDNIVGEMPDSERAILKTKFTKIVSDKNQKYIRKFDDQFLEVLVELLGWGWLKDRYPIYTPYFASAPDPDLLVKDGSDQVIAAMECKKKEHSKEEACWLQHHLGEVITGTVEARLTSPDSNQNLLLRSLRCTLSEAVDQVNRIEAPEKFVFLDLSLDVPFMSPELKRQLVCLILGLALELCQKGILLVSFEQYQVDRPITGAGQP